MPNHVSNELVFENCDEALELKIRQLCRGENGEVDFETLVPSPPNIWKGSVSSEHEENFPGNHLDWARKNWGTKWNAYDDPKIERVDNRLVITFETAWGPPRGWVVALFNTLRVPFVHGWLSEGDSQGYVETYNPADEWNMWKKSKAGEETQKHLHFLRWGVESFADEED